MKTKITKEMNASGINIGDEIPNEVRVDISRAVAGDEPKKVEQFWAAWYQLTNDRPGFGSSPVVRIK